MQSVGFNFGFVDQFFKLCTDPTSSLNEQTKPVAIITQWDYAKRTLSQPNKVLPIYISSSMPG